MSPDNPLLRALLVQPDDDILRLAMADWFEETGDSGRASFIRIQLELAGGVADAGRRRELERQQRDLLVAHDHEWVQPLAKALKCKPGEWGGWVFRGGFVEYFRLPAATINQYGHRLAQLTPIRELLLLPCEAPDVVALTEHPWLQSVTHLHLEGLRLTPEVGEALIECPFLTSLRALWYGGDEMPANLSAAFARHFRGRATATGYYPPTNAPPPAPLGETAAGGVTHDG